MNTTNLPSVLIVEDDPIISHDISIILKNKGYTIAGIAHNAVRAIDQLSSKQIDLAILDIHLGKGDTGIDVAKIIHEKYKLPYIFLTSFSDEATLEAAQEQGPYGYLVKPFQEATLLSTVSLALSNHKKSKTALHLNHDHIQLTEQEKILCSSLYKGLSYQQIADHMQVSINTVRYHIKNIYLKYDVNTRAALIAKLIK